MKLITHLILVNLILFSLGLNAQFSGGLGTKTDPYLITSVAELDSVHNHLDKHFMLMNDLDLSVYPDWIPIGSDSLPFLGSFNGNGHVIINLTLKPKYSEYGGLFGFFKPLVIGDSIKYLGLKNALIMDYYEIGIIVGHAETATIFSCFAEGKYATRLGGQKFGFIAGYINNSTISNCYSIGKDSIEISYAWVGGIAGYAKNSNIKYCYSTSRINTTNPSGGIVSGNYKTNISNCVGLNASINGDIAASHRICGSNFLGTFAKNYAWENMTVNNNIISSDTSNNNDGLNIAWSVLKDSAFYKNAINWDSNPWDFSTIWTMDTTNISPYPILRIFNKNAQQIRHTQSILWDQNLEGNVNDTINLSAFCGYSNLLKYASDNQEVALVESDKLIILKGGKSTIKAYVDGNTFYEPDSVLKTSAWFISGLGVKNDPYIITTVDELDAIRVLPNSQYKLENDLDLKGINWLPIGTELNGFMGGFDGNGHIIDNLTIESNDYYIGLFGYIISGDSIKNLGLTNIRIEGSEKTGSVAGHMENGTIYNCYANGSISGKDHLINLLGGICGYTLNSKIISCNSNVAINYGNCEIGGIVGCSYYSSINNCYSKGSLFSYNWGNGGIAGCIFKSEINNSFSTMNIGFKNGDWLGDNVVHAGGIVGSASSSSVKNSYSTGQVWYDNNIGGIAGSCSNSEVLNCYSTGYIISTDSIAGGIVGFTYNSKIYSSVALNAKVNGAGSLGRICGVTENSDLRNNYAWNYMFVGDTTAFCDQGDLPNGQDFLMRIYKDSSFYVTFAQWKFDSVWNMDKTISPYPILKSIDKEAQKLKHMQILTASWDQALPEYDIADTSFIILTASGNSPSELFVFASDNPEIASVSNDTVYYHQGGTTRLSVFYPESEFYTASERIYKDFIIDGSNANHNTMFEEFTVYPNPFSSYFILKANIDELPIAYKLINCAGVVIKSEEMDTKSTIVQTGDDLVPGLYYLQVLTSKEVLNYTIIKR